VAIQPLLDSNAGFQSFAQKAKALNSISIIGGGLAGLTLGIGLRQRGVPVTVWEAGRIPRHRVCGEFINGRGLEALGRPGLPDILMKAGARPATTAAFFLENRSLPVRTLPRPAFCLSRFKLDGVLAEGFCKAGGVLRCETRWQEKEFNEGVVRATGRCAQAAEQGWRWFGVKAHVVNVSLAADLEMHFLANGYVGLCRISDDEVNVCGLFRRRKENGETRRDPIDRLRGNPGSLLYERLSSARWNNASFCTVGGLSLRPRRAAELREFCIGDALTMIAPVTGNGMSMAFESAGLALEPLIAYARGDLSWREARKKHALQCDVSFGRRLRWSVLVQRGLFIPPLRQFILPIVLRSELSWEFLFNFTR
jgi:flavin-dependent dehydrogenase